MRLPQHVIRRRQGLYLRLRLPRDVALFTGRTHLCRSLRTSELHEARSLAAALIRPVGPDLAGSRGWRWRQRCAGRL